MRRYRKFCLRESIFDNICFLVDEGTDHPNTAINGSSSACQGKAIEIASRWRANNGPTLNAVLVALLFFRDPDQYCKETLYFHDFSGGGGVQTPCPPSGSTHEYAPINSL